MNDLCPGYGEKWRTRDLAFLWIWKEALIPLPLELQQDLIQLMFWIVRRRYLELVIATKCKPNYLIPNTLLKRRRAVSPFSYCISCPTVKDLEQLVKAFWRDDIIHMATLAHFGREHQVAELRLKDEYIKLGFVASGLYYTHEYFFHDVVLTLENDTIRCQYGVKSGMKEKLIDTTLMQLF